MKSICQVLETESKSTIFIVLTNPEQIMERIYALEDGAVDKVMFFIAPIIIGGKDSFPAVGGKYKFCAIPKKGMKMSSIEIIFDFILRVFFS